LHNKPLGCGASEVYSSSPACEEKEEKATIFRTNVGKILFESINVWEQTLKF